LCRSGRLDRPFPTTKLHSSPVTKVISADHWKFLRRRRQS